jgi:hypothetical protein
MEADCEEKIPVKPESQEMMDLTQILTTLSHQITNQNQAIQDHILQNEIMMAQVVVENDDFKRDIRSELDGIRFLLSNQQHGSSTNIPASSSVGQFSSSLPVPAPVTSTISSSPGSIAVSTGIQNQGSSTLSSAAFQNQMMLMLTESFSKLSSALCDKKDDTKSDWPKFSGDSKKFRPWYLAIMAQISLPPWQVLYDPTTNDVVKTTTDDRINGKLYAKLLISLEGGALQNVVSRAHLRAKGILLLQDLVQTYKPKHVPEVIAAKTSQFWGTTKRFSSETIDGYYNRFMELLDELSEADEKISPKSAMRHFLFTLGSEFEPIQHSFWIGSLPEAWHTQDCPTLLVLCRDYFNSV